MKLVTAKQPTHFASQREKMNFNVLIMILNVYNTVLRQKKRQIDFMTTFTPGRFQSYLFQDFSIARIKMQISPFIFEYDQ